MYYKFDYELQKLTLITWTRWLWLEEKNRPNQIEKLEGYNKQISGKLRII